MSDFELNVKVARDQKVKVVYTNNSVQHSLLNALNTSRYDYGRRNDCFNDRCRRQKTVGSGHKEIDYKSVKCSLGLLNGRPALGSLPSPCA